MGKWRVKMIQVYGGGKLENIWQPCWYGTVAENQS